MNLIYHLASNEDAARLDQNLPYECASLRDEGFIHLCTAVQLAGVLQRYYKNVMEITLLSIDEASLGETLTYENTLGGEELFPHQYGNIKPDSVKAAKLLHRAAIESLMNAQHPSTV